MFKEFSKINYNLNGQTLQFTDIFKSVKVDTSNFTKISEVQNNNRLRPDQLSNQIYQDSKLFWSLFLLNGVRNPFKQWNQSYSSLFDQNSNEFRYWFLQFANNSTYNPTISNTFSTVSKDIYDGVTFNGITLGDIAIYETGDGYFKVKAFGAGGINDTENLGLAACRAPHYGQSIIPDNFTTRNTVFHAVGGGNISACLDQQGRIWAWGQPIGLTATSNFTESSGLYRSASTGFTLLDATKNKLIAATTNQWYCYGDGCTSTISYPVTVSAGVKKMAFTKGNTFAGLILGSDNKITAYGGITSTLGYTGTVVTGLTYSDIGCVENCCFGVVFNGTDFSGSVVEFNYPGITSAIKPNPLTHHIALQVDARLMELSTPQPDLYTLQGHTLGPNGTYTRNTNHWLYKKNTTLGITGVDLTGISPWNSTVPIGPSGTLQDQWGYFNAATAITPWHFITASHFKSGEGDSGFIVGDTVRFVTNDNQVVVRTVTDFRHVPNDIQICKMDAALPSNICYYKVSPPNGLSEHLSLRDDTSKTKLADKTTCVPFLQTNQQEKMGIFPALTTTQPAGVYGMQIGNDFFESTLRTPYTIQIASGDSSSPAFFLINNELILIFIEYGGGGVTDFSDPASQQVMNTAIAEMGPAGISLTYADFSKFTRSLDYDFTKTTKIACGISHGILLKDKDVYTTSSKLNTFYGFGDNSKQQLNLPSYKQYTDASCGEYHTVALDTNKNLQTAGQIKTEYLNTACTTVETLPTSIDTFLMWDIVSLSYPEYISQGGTININSTDHNFNVNDTVILTLKQDPNTYYTGKIIQVHPTYMAITWDTAENYPYNLDTGYNTYNAIWYIQLWNTTPSGNTYSYAALQSIPGMYGTVSSGLNHAVVLGSGDNRKHMGVVSEIDDKLKRIGISSYSAATTDPVIFTDPSGSYVSFWRDGTFIKSIQHQLNSIDSYLNTTQYIKDENDKIIDLNANNNYYWKNLFITGYKGHQTNPLFVTPFKVQQELIEGRNIIKYINDQTIYLLEKAINTAVKTQNKIEIKLSEL